MPLNARLVLKNVEDIQTVARFVAESAVEHGMLHYSLVERAVLYVRSEFKDKEC